MYASESPKSEGNVAMQHFDTENHCINMKHIQPHSASETNTLDAYQIIGRKSQMNGMNVRTQVETPVVVVVVALQRRTASKLARRDRVNAHMHVIVPERLYSTYKAGTPYRDPP